MKMRTIARFYILASALATSLLSSATLWNGNVSALPDHVDWRDKGIVSPVLKQLDSCWFDWAYSTIDAISGRLALITGRYVQLSTQQIFDCTSPSTKAFWCTGGSAEAAFGYLMQNGGLVTESSYPFVYPGVKGICNYKRADAVATVTGSIAIPYQDEKTLQWAVATIGPITTSINNDYAPINNYTGGIFDDVKCVEFMGAAVTIVGYGTENGKDFWIVKTSFGDDWGEKGYIRVARNKNNMCGLATIAQYPIVEPIKF